MGKIEMKSALDMHLWIEKNGKSKELKCESSSNIPSRHKEC